MIGVDADHAAAAAVGEKFISSAKEEVNAFARICLSVCLSVSKITEKCIRMKCFVSTDVGTWTN